MANLCLLDEDGTRAEEWELGAEPLSVGRDASADVIVADAALSRRHFLIECKDGSYSLTDLNSRNGTWVDGRAAHKEPTPLHHHDCILAGRTLFLFSERPAHAPTATETAVSGLKVVG